MMETQNWFLIRNLTSRKIANGLWDPNSALIFFHDNYFGTAIAGSLRLSEIWSLGAFAGAQSSNFHSWEPFFGGEIEFEILNRYRNSVSGSFRLKGSLLVGLYQVETIAFGFATQHRQVFATTPGLVVSQDLWSILRISLGYHAGPAWRLGGYDEETRVPPLAQMIHLQAAITL